MEGEGVHTGGDCSGPPDIFSILEALPSREPHSTQECSPSTAETSLVSITITTNTTY